MKGDPKETDIKPFNIKIHPIYFKKLRHPNEGHFQKHTFLLPSNLFIDIFLLGRNLFIPKRQLLGLIALP